MATRQRKPYIQVGQELARAFPAGSGEAIEAIAMLIEDPGADHTVGGLAKIGGGVYFHRAKVVR